jgi:hypothetical protein
MFRSSCSQLKKMTENTNAKLEVDDIATLGRITLFLGNVIKPLNFIEIKLKGDDFLNKIDKIEFERYEEYQKLQERRNWGRRLHNYVVSKKILKKLKRPSPEVNLALQDLRNYILKFIKATDLANTEGNISLSKRQSETKETFAKKIEIILKHGFGIKSIQELVAFEIDAGTKKS